MLQIIGFALCAILVAIGALVYAVAHRNDDNIQAWASNCFRACGIAAVMLAAMLLYQGQYLNEILPALAR